MTTHSKDVAIDPRSQPTVFGHPAGLFTLFFAEMWERFSYYGMRALLIFYMTKGFLGYNDNQAYAIYGAYTSMVYLTPYFGGMIADYILGARRAVVIGGLLMAAGHLLMAVRQEVAFFGALALLIVGNGFFKPNISSIVGTLYPRGSTKKDAGFTLFYMGINLGAAIAPIVCGYVGETYGWHYGFGLATAGMLVGVAVFVAPRRITQLLILIGVLTTATAMPFLQDSMLQLVARIVLGGALVLAGAVAVLALERGGVPEWAGRPQNPDAARRKIGGLVRTDLVVYLGILAAIPVFALILQRDIVVRSALVATGALALMYILLEAIFRCTKIERERLFVVLILMFFSLLFWAFFEQAGSSVNNFTDRNVDRTFEDRSVAPDEVGKAFKMRIPPQASDSIADLPLLSQEQLGHINSDPAARARVTAIMRAKALGDDKKLSDKEQKKLDKDIAALNGYDRFTMTSLSILRANALRKGASDEDKVLEWKVAPQSVGMGVGGSEIPASEFQAVNPIYILIFGLLFTALWGFLAKRGWEPSTPVKFALGLAQLGLGFGALWYGAQQADSRGMVSLSWLLVGYLLHTTGELCISPVGLSMVTKLSPKRIVSTIMGAWFLAMGFANYLAGMIARFTGVSESDGSQVIPPPTETVDLYGGVFGTIALTAIGSAVLCLILSPLLTRWMHTEAYEDD